MHRDNRCMYMAHVCCYVYCVAAVVKDSGFKGLSSSPLWSGLKKCACPTLKC